MALRYGEPLDEAIYCEVMFDRGISGEIPEHRDFIYNKAIPALEKWGVKTTVIRARTSYVDNVTHIIKRGPKAGMLRGFPLCGRCTIQRDCKQRPIQRYIRTLPKAVVQYIGIAKDEQDRMMRLDRAAQVSLLDKYGVDEAGAYEICKRKGLLSPVYEFTDRGGCFFCPNAKEQELRHLFQFHPYLWARLLQVQALPNKPTERFNRTSTFAEIDAGFRAQVVAPSQ